MTTYNPQSRKAEEFIHHGEILASIEAAKVEHAPQVYQALIEKAGACKGLSHREALVLLHASQPWVREAVFQKAKEIKERFYGKRIVLFAPLYLSNYCINGCVYCPYHAKNKVIERKKLTLDEVRAEAVALMDLGHKRLALEMGEDPVQNTMEYLLDCIQAIYDIRHKNGVIRRVNVNIAATTVENYRKLHEAGIGTYILFQETYHKENYEALHPTGPKSDYAYHTQAMDRAMAGGIDDVGCGVLFGLKDYDYELAGLLMHAEHLEAVYHVGPHTLSVPRICPAQDVSVSDFANALSDDLFEYIVALLRISVPYAGIIVSTRESQESRERALEVGVSQISGGSKTTVGGYAHPEAANESAQFDISDQRSLDEIVHWLLAREHIPSFCTACYRQGRTGDRFMQLVKSGKIGNICGSNALMTLKEYLEDYASQPTRTLGMAVIDKELQAMNGSPLAQTLKKNLKEIEGGRRDLRF
ncbi:2-iminoacetate synthase (ThiH) [Clostridiaceae bacterium JG1575]|nr:2-iminoacetate synthase (ThiH) [Clostridiaceae bacterium JG1575]